MWERPEDIRGAEDDMSNPGLTCSVREAVTGTARRQLRCGKVTGMLSAFLRVLLISVPWEVLENIDLNDVRASEITDRIGSTLGCNL